MNLIVLIEKSQNIEINNFDIPEKSSITPIKNPQNYLDDPQILSGFSFFERFCEGFYEAFLPFNKKNFANSLKPIEDSLLPLTSDETTKDLLNSYSFDLKVIESSALQINKNITDPFLTIHFVDLSTGELFEVESDGFIEESNTKITSKKNVSDKNFLKYSTFEFNLVNSRKTNAIWNQKISFKIHHKTSIKSSFLILFELQNWREEWTKEKSRISKLNKICWGYLHPFFGEIEHKDFLKVQLFEYKMDHSKSNQSSFPKVPLVYFDFLWHLKEPYEAGFLLINFTFRKLSFNSMQCFDEIKNDLDNKDEWIDETVNQQEINDQKLTDQEVEREKFLESIRFSDEFGFQLPTSLYKKINTGHFGCSALKFSPNGRFLAFTSTDKSNFTSIKIWDFEKCNEYCTFYYHSNIIHKIAWTIDSAFIATCSSDKFIKLFKIPKKKRENQLNFTKMLKYMKVEIEHPNFCYDVGFLFEKSDFETNSDKSSKKERNLTMGTCCFDGKFRIFEVCEKENRFLEKICILVDEQSFPNCFFFAENKIFLGSSIGIIHKYQIEKQYGKITIVFAEKIEKQEMKGDVINKLEMTPDLDYLIVQTRDNCIRLLELKTNNIINRYFKCRFSKNNIKFFASPDYRYLFSGCETGQLKVWDFMSSYLVDHLMSYRVNGLVYTGDCNLKYNVVAIGGFGQSFPMAIFIHKKEQLI